MGGGPLSFGEMPEGHAMAPPRGYAAMCSRDAPLCARSDAAGPHGAELRLLAAVNRRVNVSVRQVTDEIAFHRDEYWRPAGDGFGARGDCEDIAIQKRLELRRAGVRDEDMFYAVGYRRDLGLHTVLVARTDGGDVVLDSRTPDLRFWAAAPYVWVTRQSGTDPRAWYAVERAPVLTLAENAPLPLRAGG